MISSRSFLVRALYDWIVANQWTPYIVVNTTNPEVSVPKQYIEDGKIVLNISPTAVAKLHITHETLEFDASFGGLHKHVHTPMSAITAIYAFENGRGMVFQGEDDIDSDDDSSVRTPETKSEKPTTSASKGKPNLKIVK